MKLPARGTRTTRTSAVGQPNYATRGESSKVGSNRQHVQTWVGACILCCHAECLPRVGANHLPAVLAKFVTVRGHAAAMGRSGTRHTRRWGGLGMGTGELFKSGRQKKHTVELPADVFIGIGAPSTRVEGSYGEWPHTPGPRHPARPIAPPSTPSTATWECRAANGRIRLEEALSSRKEASENRRETAANDWPDSR